jgi:hypothetical protein
MRNAVTRASKQVSLINHESRTRREKDEGNSSDLPESAQFDPINLQKERFGEESKENNGKPKDEILQHVLKNLIRKVFLPVGRWFAFFQRAK